MALSGNLNEFPLADILTLLNQQKKSGSLTIVNGKKKARLLIYQGNILEVAVNQRSPEILIKNILVAQGKLTAAGYREMLVLASDTGLNLSEVLVSKSVLSTAEAKDWFQIIAEELVFELMTWKSGRYHFTVQDLQDFFKERTYELKSEFIILEGLRQLDEWPSLQKKIPPEESVFKIKNRDYREYDLGADAYVIALIDGVSNLAEIRNKSPFGQFRFYSILMSLWKEDFIEQIKISPGQSRRFDVAGLVLQYAVKEAPFWGALGLFASALVLRLFLGGTIHKPWDAWERGRNSVDKAKIESFAAEFAVVNGGRPEFLKEVLDMEILSLREWARMRNLLPEKSDSVE